MLGLIAAFHGVSLEALRGSGCSIRCALPGLASADSHVAPQLPAIVPQCGFPVLLPSLASKSCSSIWLRMGGSLDANNLFFVKFFFFECLGPKSWEPKHMFKCFGPRHGAFCFTFSKTEKKHEPGKNALKKETTKNTNITQTNKIEQREQAQTITLFLS